MQNDNYEKISEKIEKLNFHAYKERIEIQKNLERIAIGGTVSVTKNGQLLKVIIGLQILSLCKDFPLIADFIKLVN
tara:strand:- start:5620 stop:5847 length:228 start_codon:yes stop_codon:yes gene_type:complete